MELRDFARAADQEFDVFVGETTVTMTLIDVAPLPLFAGAVREGFALIFKCASPIVLPQQMYFMRNKSLAGAQKVGVFVVPIARDTDGVRYQAIFN